MAECVSRPDLDALRETQKDVYARLQSSHRALAGFNEFSASQLATLSDVRRRTAMLRDLRSDVDSVFRRMRALRRKLAQRYPEEYAAAEDAHPTPNLAPDDDDEQD